MKNTDLLADKLDFTYKKEENQNDIRSLIAIGVNYWYVFVAFITIGVIGTFIYIQHLPNKWNIVSKIIIEEDKTTSVKSLTNGMNADMASLFDIKSNADNEVRVLKSSSLIKSVIARMHLNVHIYNDNGFKETELYDNAPFIAVIHYEKGVNNSRNYQVKIQGTNTYAIKDEKSGLEFPGVFGTPLHLASQTLTLSKTSYFLPNGNYRLLIESLKSEEKNFMANYNVALNDKQATIIDLQLSYNNPNRGEQILQTLMQMYLQNNLANKIRIADSTMKFIDNRLVVVGAELNRVEKSLEQYKVKNKISDIGAQAKALVAGADEYQNKINDNQVQLDVVNNLYKYVSDGNNPQIVPSSLILRDMAFGTAINAYNEMLLHKEQLKLSLVDKSSIIVNLDQQIELARKSLMNSLNNYRASLQVSQRAFSKQNAVIRNNMSDAPVKERVYLDYARQQALKQDLYLFLLQKREETAISQTATISSCRILDNAESDEYPYAPKRSAIYFIGLFVSVFAAITVLCIKSILNIRINTKADISKHTSVPLLGEISRNYNNKKLLAYNDAHSIVLEEIRALRTSLKYAAVKDRSNVILFTSSMSGEGKSFISLNLGNSIALTGKKVVLLELDLRKPKLLKNIGIDNEYGFTNYVISDEKNIDHLIKPSTFNENFYFISSGTIPPNPAELLLSNKLKVLIDELKNKFDYVIIDTAPVGLVSDALIIEEFADITCYVVRQNFTYKSQLGIVNDLHKARKVKQLYLIVNDIEIKKNSITGYGHGYGNYGYAMANEEGDDSKLTTFLKKLMPSTR